MPVMFIEARDVTIEELVVIELALSPVERGQSRRAILLSWSVRRHRRQTNTSAE